MSLLVIEAKNLISGTFTIVSGSDKPSQSDPKCENTLPAPLIAKSLEQTQIGKYHTKGGHGFAAEDANHFADAIRGKQAKVVGTVNQINGPDRMVNGLLVQSKYCRTAAESIGAAFDPVSGQYRYTGQRLEVPKDQYQACLAIMREKIRQGRVQGLTSPADAEKIVYEGTITYRQARNIARAGNLDSLVFDAKSQAVTSTYVFAISFAATYAHKRWHGESHQGAIRIALQSAVLAGSTTLVVGVLSAQLLRTRTAAIGTVVVRNGLSAVGSTGIGKSVIHNIAAGSLGKVVPSAAAINHVSKLLRSNAIAGAIATAVASTPDFYRAAFDRSISWQQFAKNLSVNVVSVAGGSAGWIAGTATGAVAGSVVPGFGTAIGGIVGGIVGALGIGFGASAAGKLIADKLLADDSTKLCKLLQNEIEALAFDFMLTEDEVENIAAAVQKTASPKWFRQMFKVTKQGGDEQLFRELVRDEFEPKFVALVEKREKLSVPSPEELENDVSVFLDELIAAAA